MRAASRNVTEKIDIDKDARAVVLRTHDVARICGRSETYVRNVKALGYIRASIADDGKQRAVLLYAPGDAFAAYIVSELDRQRVSPAARRYVSALCYELTLDQMAAKPIAVIHGNAVWRLAGEDAAPLRDSPDHLLVDLWRTWGEFCAELIAQIRESCARTAETN